MYNPMSLEDKNIIVTGGGAGIGRATAIEICKLGGHVCLVDINQQGMEDTLLHCSQRSQAFQTDLSNLSEIKNTFRGGVTIMGKFHGLVHCAGLASVVPLRMLSEENYRKVMDVNVLSIIELAKQFTRKKICVGEGSSIVLISSVYGLVGSACNLAYAASKAAVVGMTKSLGIELAPKGIRVNCIAPGFIKTDMSEDVEAKFDQSYSDVVEAMHPLGWGKAEDVAHGIAYLLSDAARWMTGSVMSIDGGYTAQ